jgi:hypothetical protein
MVLPSSTNVSSLTSTYAKAYTSASVPTDLDKKCVQLALKGLNAAATSASSEVSGVGSLGAHEVSQSGMQCVNDEAPITRGAVFVAEFVPANATVNDSQVDTLAVAADGVQSTISKTSTVYADSAAVHTSFISLVPEDPVVDTAIPDSSDGSRTVTLTSGTKYRGFRLANAADARSDSSDPITISEPVENEDALTCKEYVTRDPNTNQLVTDGNYNNASDHVSYLTDSTLSMVDGVRQQNFELTLNVDTPPINVGYRLTTSAGYIVLAKENDVVTDAANIDFRIGVTDTSVTPNVTDIRQFVSSVDQAEFSRILGSYAIVSGFNFQIESLEPNFSDPDYHAPGYFFRDGDDDTLSNLDYTGLLTNYTYFNKVMSSDVQHLLSINSGDLTKVSGLNLSEFSLSDGREYLNSSEFLAAPYVKIYETTKVNTISSSSTNRRASVVTSGSVDKLDTVHVCYAADSTLSGTTISEELMSAGSVSYTIEPTLSSTSGSAGQSLWGTDSVIDSSAVLVKNGDYDENTSVAISDYTMDASSYTFPNGKITIMDINPGQVWTDESPVYYGNYGSYQVEDDLKAAVTITNANMALVDQRDLRLRIVPKNISTMVAGFPAGWTAGATNGTDTRVNLDNSFLGIFGDKLKTFMDTLSQVQINIAVSMIQQSYGDSTHYETITVTSTTGPHTVVSQIENDEFTYNQISRTTSAPVDVTSSYTNLPNANTVVREFTRVIVYTIKTNLRLGVVTNVSMTTPTLTKTIVFRRLYDTATQKYLPVSDMETVLYNGERMVVSQATLSGSASLNITWTIAAGDVPLKLRPCYVFIEKGDDFDWTPSSYSGARADTSICPFTSGNATVTLTGFGASNPSASIYVWDASVLNQPMYFQDLKLKADFSTFSAVVKEFNLDDPTVGSGNFDLRASTMPVSGTTIATTISVSAVSGGSVGSQSSYTLTLVNTRGSIELTCITNPTQNLRIFNVQGGSYNVTKTIDGVTTTYSVTESGSGSNKYIVLDDGVYIPVGTGAAEQQGTSSTITLDNNVVEFGLFNGYNGAYSTVGGTRVDPLVMSSTETKSRNVTLNHVRGYNGLISVVDTNVLSRTMSTIVLTVSSISKTTTITQTWDLLVGQLDINDLSNGVGDLGITFDNAISMLAVEESYNKYIDVYGDKIKVTVSAPGTNNPAINYVQEYFTTENIPSPIYNPVANGYATFLPAKVIIDNSFLWSVTLSAGSLSLFKFEDPEVSTINLKTQIDQADWTLLGYISNDYVQSTDGAYFGKSGIYDPAIHGSLANALVNYPHHVTWNLKKYSSSGSFDVVWATRAAQLKITYQKPDSISAVPFTPNSADVVEYYYDVSTSSFSSIDRTLAGAGSAHLIFGIPVKTFNDYLTNRDPTIYDFRIHPNKWQAQLRYTAEHVGSLASVYDYNVAAGYLESATDLTRGIRVTRNPAGTNNDEFKIELDGLPFTLSSIGLLEQADDLSIHIKLASQFLYDPVTLEVTAGDSVRTNVYVVDSVTPYSDDNTAYCVKVARYTSGDGGIAVSTWNDNSVTFWKPYASTKEVYTIDVSNFNSLPAAPSSISFANILETAISNVSTVSWETDTNWTPRALDFSFGHNSKIGQEKMALLFNITQATPKKVIVYDFNDKERHEDIFGAPKYRVTQSGATITRNAFVDSLGIRPLAINSLPAGTTVYDVIRALFGESITNLTGQTNVRD